jgi:hypothetical protein
MCIIYDYFQNRLRIVNIFVSFNNKKTATRKSGGSILKIRLLRGDHPIKIGRDFCRGRK